MSRRLILILTVLIWSLGSGASYALTPLTRATVQQIRNIVRLQPQRQSARPARISDPMVPGDALSTGNRSSADVVFNDGSLARLGAQALFNFRPNTRDIDLRGGTVLALIRPGQGLTRIRTPNAAAGIRGSALFMRYVPETKTSIIAALTNSDITVSNDEVTQSLAAGQMAVFEGDRLQGVYEFDLSSFYATSEIVRGLDLSAENPQAIAIEGAILDEVRAEIRQGLASQGSLAEMPMQENPAFLSAVSARTNSSPLAPSPMRPGMDVNPGRLLDAGETQFLEASPASQFEPDPVVPGQPVRPQPGPGAIPGFDMGPLQPGSPMRPGGSGNPAQPATPAQPGGPGTPATPAIPAQPGGPIGSQPPIRVDPTPDPSTQPTVPTEPPVAVEPGTPAAQPDPGSTLFPVQPPVSVDPVSSSESAGLNLASLGINLGVGKGNPANPPATPPETPPGNPTFELPGLPRQD